jgi:hypothetical protein
MSNTKRVILLLTGLAIGAFAVAAFATSPQPQNNNNNHAASAAQASAASNAVGVGVGVGVGLGGNATVGPVTSVNESFNLNQNRTEMNTNNVTVNESNQSTFAAGGNSTSNGGNATGGNGFGGQGGASASYSSSSPYTNSVGLGGSSQARNDNVGNNTGTANVVVEGDQAQARNPVSTAIAPTVITGSDQCLVPVGLGGQGVGFGISFGYAVRDEICEVLKLSRQVEVLVDKAAALQLLRMHDTRVDAALKALGK